MNHKELEVRDQNNVKNYCLLSIVVFSFLFISNVFAHQEYQEGLSVPYPNSLRELSGLPPFVGDDGEDQSMLIDECENGISMSCSFVRGETQKENQITQEESSKNENSMNNKRGGETAVECFNRWGPIVDRVGALNPYQGIYLSNQALRECGKLMGR